MRHGKHIHTADDGRGPRDVFLNGKYVDRVIGTPTFAPELSELLETR